MLQYYILDCTQLTKLVKAEGEIYVIIAAWFLGSRNENFSESLGFCCCSFFERKCGKTCRTCKAHRVCAPTFRMPCLGKKKKKSRSDQESVYYYYYYLFICSYGTEAFK